MSGAEERYSAEEAMGESVREGRTKDDATGEKKSPVAQEDMKGKVRAAICDVT